MVHLKPERQAHTKDTKVLKMRNNWSELQRYVMVAQKERRSKKKKSFKSLQKHQANNLFVIYILLFFGWQDI